MSKNAVADRCLENTGSPAGAILSRARKLTAFGLFQLPGTLLLFLLAGVAIAQAPSYTPKPYGSLKQVMRGVALPSSDIIFGVQGKEPKTDAEWQIVENASVAIEETANLILLRGRVRSNGQPVPVQAADYAKFAAALIPAGRDCLKAAQKKNQDDVSNCTDSLSQACDNCHKVYRDPPQK
jgi:cytochrome c556